MRTRRQATIRDLRVAIDCLPVSTRVAMLEGMRSNEIIVGAYANGGGVCPMLAAHRRGARTDFISFARTWDRFTRADRTSRQATERELRILVTQLEDSLCSANGLELDTAISQHRALRSRRLLADGARHAPGGDQRRSRAGRSKSLDGADPSGEIRARRLRLPRLQRRAQPAVDGPRETTALATARD
jgi:hypothetical protein